MTTLLVTRKKLEVQGSDRLTRLSDVIPRISDTNVNWVFDDKPLTLAVMKNDAWKKRPRSGSAFLSFPVNVEYAPIFEGRFANVAYGGQTTAWLKPEAFVEAIVADNASNLAIGGMVRSDLGLISIWRGNATAITFPTSCLKVSGDGITPDLSRFSIGDYGNTLVFGEYEASFESILYEFDPRFRLEYKKNRRKIDNSFGACLRRLRIQKKIRQSDFPGVSSKTIERIEANSVKRIQTRTKNAIAATLGVPWEDIQSF